MSRKLSPSLVPLCLLVALLVVSPVVLQAAPSGEPEPATPKVVAAPAADQPAAVASRCQRCGDGYCAKSCENEISCPADCAPQPKVAAARCGKCGDGQCVRQCGETAETCPLDCGGSPSVSAPAPAKAADCAADKSTDAAAAPAGAKKE